MGAFALNGLQSLENKGIAPQAQLYAPCAMCETATALLLWRRVLHAPEGCGKLEGSQALRRGNFSNGGCKAFVKA